MAFVRNTLQVGDVAVTTRVVETFGGYFEPGTQVTITEISERGYGFTDENGNRAVETGWNSVRRYKTIGQ